jgi:hypothetical protein
LGRRRPPARRRLREIFSISRFNRRIMEKKATNPERRSMPREKMLGTGLMSWSDGRRSMQCVVLDWTQSGARIRPSDMLGCPDQFTLISNNGNRVPCEVKWREDMVMGVRFI